MKSVKTKRKSTALNQMMMADCFPKSKTINERNSRDNNEEVESMFGLTLKETMQLQAERLPDYPLKIPWVLPSLGQKIIDLEGQSIEGIFRVPANYEDICHKKVSLDQWRIDDVDDCYTASALFKQWLRDLSEPLVPYDLYKDALELGEKLENPGLDDCPEKLTWEFMAYKMEPTKLNYRTLAYLVEYLQGFTVPAIEAKTKMNARNLATIFAPNILRAPKPMAEKSTRSTFLRLIDSVAKEKNFLTSLIKWLNVENLPCLRKSPTLVELEKNLKLDYHQLVD